MHGHSGAIHREVEGLRSLTADLGLGLANRINTSEPCITTEIRKERKKRMIRFVPKGKLAGYGCLTQSIQECCPAGRQQESKFAKVRYTERGSPMLVFFELFLKVKNPNRKAWSNIGEREQTKQMPTCNERDKDTCDPRRKPCLPLFGALWQWQ